MTEPEARRRAVVQFYDTLLDDREGSEVLGWSTPWSQEVRFEALAAIGDLSGRTVLDVGCGRGDLCGWLRERYEGVMYRGVDLHAGMIDLARKAYPDAEFTVRDVLEDDSVDEADYVVSSGLFALTVNVETEFVDAMLARMMALAREGVAVNFLSNRTPGPEDPRCRYSDPADILARAFRLTDHVTLKHDYKPNDFTIHLKHRLPEPPA